MRLNEYKINSISSQTGACVVTIWSRGNLDDNYEPCWMVTDNASTFVPDVLGKSMWSVTRLLEQWACSKAGGEFRMLKVLWCDI